jgi:hypothetical protein
MGNVRLTPNMNQPNMINMINGNNNFFHQQQQQQQNYNMLGMQTAGAFGNQMLVQPIHQPQNIMFHNQFQPNQMQGNQMQANQMQGNQMQANQMQSNQMQANQMQQIMNLQMQNQLNQQNPNQHNINLNTQHQQNIMQQTQNQQNQGQNKINTMRNPNQQGGITATNLNSAGGIVNNMTQGSPLQNVVQLTSQNQNQNVGQLAQNQNRPSNSQGSPNIPAATLPSGFSSTGINHSQFNLGMGIQNMPMQNAMQGGMQHGQSNQPGMMMSNSPLIQSGVIGMNQQLPGTPGMGQQLPGTPQPGLLSMGGGMQQLNRPVKPPQAQGQPFQNTQMPAQNLKGDNALDFLATTDSPAPNSAEGLKATNWSGLDLANPNNDENNGNAPIIFAGNFNCNVYRCQYHSIDSYRARKEISCRTSKFILILKMQQIQPIFHAITILINQLFNFGGEREQDKIKKLTDMVFNSLI